MPSWGWVQPPFQTRSRELLNLLVVLIWLLADQPESDLCQLCQSALKAAKHSLNILFASGSQVFPGLVSELRFVPLRWLRPLGISSAGLPACENRQWP
jgi:hypothetical protein